jgi:predicted ATPase
VIVGVDVGAEASDRDALFYSVREFLEAAARERPTVLVFEDIHWADTNLLDLVLALAGLLRRLPILFLTLARPELTDARPDWGSGLPEYLSLTLGPLGEADARELLARRLGRGEQADAVIGVAEGNPLFIEQLAASIGEVAPGRLPTTIREIVAARLDALPRAERSLLLDAAVVGKVFWVDALRALDADGDLTPLLDRLERRDLIRRETSSIIEGKQQFAFTHALIRDVAYDLLPRADRARRHALVAEFFGRTTGGSGEAIGAMARHWRAAGDNERAVEQLLRAAELAERGWAKDHAAVLYREAFELVPPEDTERRNAVRRRLALASTASFHLPDVRPGGSRPA